MLTVSTRALFPIVILVAACGDSTGVGGDGAGASGGSDGGGAAGAGGGGGVGGEPSGGGGGAPTDGGGGSGGGTTCHLDGKCDPSLAAECLCEGCGDGSTCDETVDCICPACASDEFCADPKLCNDDGACDPYAESCICADCAAFHPLCP